MGSSGHSADSEFAKECLESHNKFRALHGVKPLEWDRELSAFAQDWAEKNLKKGKMEHSKKSGYGENLWSSSGKSKTPCTKAAGAWYSEIKMFDYNDPKFESKTGHFTQLVWKKSSKLGCGVAEKKSMFVSCSYKPPGNSGGYNTNVPPLLAGGGAPEAPAAS